LTPLVVFQGRPITGGVLAATRRSVRTGAEGSDFANSPTDVRLQTCDGANFERFYGAGTTRKKRIGAALTGVENSISAVGEAMRLVRCCQSPLRSVRNSMA